MEVRPWVGGPWLLQGETERRFPQNSIRQVRHVRRRRDDPAKSLVDFRLAGHRVRVRMVPKVPLSRGLEAARDDPIG